MDSKPIGSHLTLRSYPADEPCATRGRLFIQQLNSKEYTNKSRKRVRARSPSPDSADSADDHDGQPAAPITDRPIYTTGPHIRETKIGALRGIRTGEPYWFIHQGNCEHIWEVNAVR